MKMTQSSTDLYVAPNQIRIDEFYKRMGIDNEQERLAVLTNVIR
jgi:hypothetical protein